MIKGELLHLVYTTGAYPSLPGSLARYFPAVESHECEVTWLGSETTWSCEVLILVGFEVLIF